MTAWLVQRDWKRIATLNFYLALAFLALSWIIVPIFLMVSYDSVPRLALLGGMLFYVVMAFPLRFGLHRWRHAGVLFVALWAMLGGLFLWTLADDIIRLRDDAAFAASCRATPDRRRVICGHGDTAYEHECSGDCRNPFTHEPL